jgi:hypothetical protein
MSFLRGLFTRPDPNNNNNFTLKAPRLNRSLNTLYKKSKETQKRKINTMYPYGLSQNFESPTYLHETNNPLVPHTLGRKLYIACIDEKYDIAQSLINDIIKTDKTQLDYIGENGTPLIAVGLSLFYNSDAARINSPDSKAKVQECIQLIKKLIDAGANIEIHSHKFFYNNTIISMLVGIHNEIGLMPLYDIIHLLLNKGANLNIISDNGHTTLDIANYGQSDLAGEIFAKGGRTSKDLTPQLFESCLALREKALLTISDIDKKNLGKMLLHECIRQDIDTPLILTYISEGADLDEQIDKTPLLWLCSKINQIAWGSYGGVYGSKRDEFFRKLSKVRKECDKLAVILIKAGANLDMVDRKDPKIIDSTPPRSGYNALIHSIYNDYYDTPTVLVEYGANLNIIVKTPGYGDSTALDILMREIRFINTTPPNSNRNTEKNYTNFRSNADSLIKLIREKGGLTAKELSGTVVNWKQKSVVKKGGAYRRQTRKLLKNTRR